MASDGTTVERLRQFLRELKPEARAMLIAELERSMLRGDAVAGGEFILQELLRIVRESRGLAPRLGAAVRQFYIPLEPFMLDDVADHGHSHRIARAALTALWTWLSSSLLPDDTKTFCDAATDALVAGDKALATRLTRAFQDRVAQQITQAFEQAEGDDRALRRISGQIGVPRAENSARLLALVLTNRDRFQQFSTSIPLQIDDFVDPLLSAIKARIDAEAARDPSTLPCLLVLTMDRLSERWQAVRLAVKAASSDHAARVATTSYAVAVNIVLADLSRMVSELKSELHSGRGMACGALLKQIHRAVRGLRTELDLPADSAWGRQLAALRAQIADLLKSEIESMPGRVRRLLRPRAPADIRPGAVLDNDDVAETETLVDFVRACRNFADELAIKEMTQRTYSEVQQYLDNTTRTLIDGLRGIDDGGQALRLSQVHAAIRLCGKVFGPEYAAMMAKSAEAAVRGEPSRAKA